MPANRHADLGAERSLMCRGGTLKSLAKLPVDDDADGRLLWPPQAN
jgi:hypothetical protein